MAEPVSISYGKDAVSVYRTNGERLFSCEVRLLAYGERFVPSYTEGDNSMVVATDSMKNFIHKHALEYEAAGLEDFLVVLGERFIERYDQVDSVELYAREVVFAPRAGVVFQRLYDDYCWAHMNLYRARDVEGHHFEGDRLERSGRNGLHLVKLRGSSFADFVRDEYTTLPDAHDRPLFVHMDVSWHNADYGRRADGDRMREHLIGTFADFESESIQHLVNEMGSRALSTFPEIDNIAFRAENRLWDTAQATDEVTVYTDARPPFGVITLSLGR
jgi:urate oxidase / 2-oxo-4-hydroxy-4-carboxy-5-ureidoimidazoline decarboxylase